MRAEARPSSQREIGTTWVVGFRSDEPRVPEHQSRDGAWTYICHRDHVPRRPCIVLAVSPRSKNPERFLKETHAIKRDVTVAVTGVRQTRASRRSRSPGRSMGWRSERLERDRRDRSGEHCCIDGKLPAIYKAVSESAHTTQIFGRDTDRRRQTRPALTRRCLQRLQDAVPAQTQNPLRSWCVSGNDLNRRLPC